MSRTKYVWSMRDLLAEYVDYCTKEGVIMTFETFVALRGVK